MGKAKRRQMMMKKFLIIILTFFYLQVSGQIIRPEIKDLVLKIEKYDKHDSKHVGIAGETTDQYRNFEKLLEVV